MMEEDVTIEQEKGLVENNKGLHKFGELIVQEVEGNKRKADASREEMKEFVQTKKKKLKRSNTKEISNRLVCIFF